LNNDTNFKSLLSNYNYSLLDDLPYSIDRFKQSILIVNVYYKDMSHLEIIESAETNMDKIISAIGGNMGLFLGMSLLTLLEIVELIYNLIRA
jgi:hypothetical protein